MPGISDLEEKITQMEALLEEMRGEIREAHGTLKQMRVEKKEIQELLSTEVKELVHTRVDEVIKTELNKIGPEVREQTNLIYAKVGTEIDKLITLSLGKEFSTRRGHEDVRPELAARLRLLIEEIITEEENKR